MKLSRLGLLPGTQLDPELDTVDIINEVHQALAPIGQYATMMANHQHERNMKALDITAGLFGAAAPESCKMIEAVCESDNKMTIAVNKQVCEMTTHIMDKVTEIIVAKANLPKARRVIDHVAEHYVPRASTIQDLVDETGCDATEARQALMQTHGDVEAATQQLRRLKPAEEPKVENP